MPPLRQSSKIRRTPRRVRQQQTSTVATSSPQNLTDSTSSMPQAVTDSQSTLSPCREVDIKRPLADIDAENRIIELREKLRILRAQNRASPETSSVISTPITPAGTASSRTPSTSMPSHGSGPSFTSNHDNRPPIFLSLVELFPTANREFISEIWWGTFDPSNFQKLSNAGGNSFTQQDDAAEAELKGIAQFVMCMEIYCQIVRQLAPPQTRGELDTALSAYRYRIYQHFEFYTFDSVVLFNEIFIYTRLIQGQDNLDAWRTVNTQLESRILIKKEP